MNIYVYGPKDDPYHRTKWRENYPEDKAAIIRGLAEAAKRTTCRLCGLSTLVDQSRTVRQTSKLLLKSWNTFTH